MGDIGFAERRCCATQVRKKSRACTLIEGVPVAGIFSQTSHCACDERVVIGHTAFTHELPRPNTSGFAMPGGGAGQKHFSQMTPNSFQNM